MHRDMLNNSFMPYLYKVGKNNDYWFIKDAARLNWIHQTSDLLSENVDIRILCLDSERKAGNRINWTRYSPDLN